MAHGPYLAGESIVVTDIFSLVSKTPSGVAHDRPDGARRLFTTAVNMDKLLTDMLISLTPPCVHGRVVTSHLGTYVDHRFTWRCLYTGLREQRPMRAIYQFDRKQAPGVENRLTSFRRCCHGGKDKI